MNAKRGYYSLIQFCPDPSRSEAVNVGVLLFCPEKGFIAVRNRRSNKRAKKLIFPETIDSASLNTAKQAIENRLEVECESFKSLEDLQQFVNTRANILKLTPPRPIKVVDPEKDLEQLYNELVGGIARQKTKCETELPKLKLLFDDLHKQGRARLDLNITIPLIGSKIHIPYAFNNEVLNLVKPCLFSGNEDIAIRRAQQLSIDGDLLHKNNEGKLVIITSYANTQTTNPLKNRIDELFNEYHVQPIHQENISDYISHVREVAH